MPIVAYSSDYSSPWFSGVAVADASIVPGQFPVAVNGRPYMLNDDPQAIDSYGEFFNEESLPLLRQQADQAKTAAEQSLDPRQFWRRGQETWHGGAGQSVLDRETSDNKRFSTSKGVNPWTRYQLSLLHSTSFVRANTVAYPALVLANGFVYSAEGTGAARSSNLSAWTTMTGLPGTAIVSMATDGINVYTAHGASGVYRIAGGTVAASHVTGTYDNVFYAKGRLLVTNGPALYNPTAPPASGTALATLDTNWLWTAATDGNNCIYAAGYTGNTSRIYRITITAEGSSLGAPIVAATLPNEEVVRCLYGYMGYVIIGTDKGVRFATAESTGDLTLGALIPTTAAVRCLDAAGQFVWFGWTNYDGSSAGLGRMDLTTINEGLAPAYASDLMSVGSQGTVVSTVAIGGRRAFSFANAGIYAENASGYVTSGTLTTGQITYGISDAKVGVKLDLKHTPLLANNSISASASYDRSTTLASLGTSAAAGTVSPVYPLSASNKRHEEVELTFTLTSSLNSGTPTLTRWTYMAYPAPQGASIVTLPLLLYSQGQTLRDAEYRLDVKAEYLILTGLYRDREIITVQVGDDSFAGVIEEFKWLPQRRLNDRSGWDGTFIAKIRRIEG